jgi:hypothetical protein
VVATQHDPIAVKPLHLAPFDREAFRPLEEQRASPLEGPVPTTGHSMRLEVRRSSIAKADALRECAWGGARVHG